MRLLYVLPLAVAVAGCAGRGARAGAEPFPARSPARDSLLQTDAGRTAAARELGYVEATFALLAADVAYLRGGVPTVYGRDAARAVLAAGRDTATEAYQWDPLGGGISRDGRSGYTFGVTAVAAIEKGAAPRLQLSRYIAFWTRAAGGPWRISAYAEIGRDDERPSGLAIPVRWSTPPQASLTTDPVPELEDLRRTDAMFSAAGSREGVAAAFGAWAAPDAILFAGSEVVSGPAAIREYFASTMGSSLAWQPVHAGVASSGDLGFTVGDWVSTGRRPNGAIFQRFGKYLTIWRKQGDGGGSWRFVIDGGNGSPPPGESRASEGTRQH